MDFRHLDDPRWRWHAQKLATPQRRRGQNASSDAARLASIDTLIDDVARARLHRAVEALVHYPTPENRVRCGSPW